MRELPDIRPLILIMLIQKRQVQRLLQQLSCTLLLFMAYFIWGSCLHMAKREFAWIDPIVYLAWSFSVWLNVMTAWTAGKKIRRVQGAIKILQKHLETDGGNMEQIEGVVQEAVSP